MNFSVLPLNVKVAILGIFAVLITATIISRFLQERNPRKDYKELIQRVNTWWVMAGIFSFAMITTRAVSIIFFAFISFLALKEYFSLIPSRRADRRVLFWAYVAIIFQYLWVGKEWYGMFIIFIPVYAFLFLPLRMVLIGQTSGFLNAAATIHWGLMITVFNLSHASFLLVLPPERNPVGGGAGLVLFLVVLTQLNDVAQYIFGKSFGKRKIIPKVSPKKTLAGFFGGVATTVALACAIAKLLTPLTFPQAVMAGVIIGVGGFVGDVTISCFKRDLGIKDSGSILPGHGGILDRIDSLTYTAPLFFHFIYYLHY